MIRWSILEISRYPISSTYGSSSPYGFRASLRTPDAATLFAEFMSWLRRGCGLANFFVQLATCPATWKKSSGFFLFFLDGKNQGNISGKIKIWQIYGKTRKDQNFFFWGFWIFENRQTVWNTEIVFEKVFECFWDSDKGLRIGQLVVDSGKHMLANSNAK